MTRKIRPLKNVNIRVSGLGHTNNWLDPGTVSMTARRRALIDRDPNRIPHRVGWSLRLMGGLACADH